MENRFSILLAFLLTVLLLLPAFAATPQSSALLALAYGSMLVSGVFAVEGGWMRNVALALAVPAIGVDVWDLVSGERHSSLLSIVLDGAFLFFTAGAMLRHILSQTEVTSDLVLGGTCVYLFMAILFAQVYVVVDLSIPGAFRGPGELEATAGARQFVEFTYFSLVTITTLGYGDIIPLHPVPRAIASVQAVVGQLYLAIFIGNLVGLRVSATSGQATREAG